MKFILTPVLFVALLFGAVMTNGCAYQGMIIDKASEEALERMEPAQRAAYRNILEDATESYDSRYDRDGNLLPTEPAPTPDPAPVE